MLQLAFPVGGVVARIGSLGYTSRAADHCGATPVPNGEGTRAAPGISYVAAALIQDQTPAWATNPHPP